MSSILVLIAITLLLVAFGVAENVVHKRHLKKIPIRIHVNGTRGKSSVTRLIAAGLRAGNIATCAKTTGTLPRMIFPDGSELPVFRSTRPNIIEQKRIVAVAADERAQAMVVECMAVQPALQALSEWKLIRATHSVITNVRPDHLDVMGPTEADVARALCGTIAVGGKLFTSELGHLPILRSAAADRRSEMIEVGEPEILAVSAEDLAQFSYKEHPDNVALALRVCADLGVERAVALPAMQRVPQDPGATVEHRLDFFGRTITFFNAFAANDPVSTKQLWEFSLAQVPDAKTRVALFNCRADRADRSAHLGQAHASWIPASWVVLMGSGTHHFARAATRAGIDGSSIVLLEGLTVEEIFERLIELGGHNAVITGMGNIGGQGLDLARYFSNRSLARTV